MTAVPPSKPFPVGIRRWFWALPPLAALGLVGWALSVHVQPSTTHPLFLVSQRDREFKPGELTVKTGDVVRIVNDDGDLTHHAYVSSPKFNFDSGDQAPGRDVNITFDVPGTFNVLCGIHPKMRLTVKVQY